MLQALASGLPIIAADAPWLKGLVVSRKNGYLIAPSDSDCLAEKMNMLAKDPVLRQKMGKESRKISVLHDRIISLTKLEELYKTIIASKT